MCKAPKNGHGAPTIRELFRKIHALERPVVPQYGTTKL